MVDVNCHESTQSFRALSADELDAVTGGNTKVSPPPSKPAPGNVFEIEDYSFD
jgi:hypothetical protein